MYNEDENAVGPTPHITARIAPHAYWRTIERPDYNFVHRMQLTCMLGAVTTTDGLWRRALCGEAASSVAIAMRIRRPTTIAFPVDLRMSVLLNAALDGDHACALVMANMLSRMPLGDDRRRRLASSWSVFPARSPLLVPPEDNNDRSST